MSGGIATTIYGPKTGGAWGTGLPLGGSGGGGHVVSPGTRLTGSTEVAFVSGNTRWMIGIAGNTGFTQEIIGVSNLPSGVTVSPIPTSTQPATSITITDNNVSPRSFTPDVRFRDTNTTSGTVDTGDLRPNLHSFLPWYATETAVAPTGALALPTQASSQGRFNSPEIYDSTRAGVTFVTFYIPEYITTNPHVLQGGLQASPQSQPVSGQNYRRYIFRTTAPTEFNIRA